MNFNTILIKIRFDWDRFGLKEKVTAANQLTDYVYDETGLLREILSKYGDRKNPDRSIAREYDDLDRLVKVTYDGRDVETYSYDSWGKMIASTRNGRKATYRYDYFGRLIEKTEDGAITRYAYNAWGQRTARETVNGSLKLTETREYDALGRLSKIRNGNGGELAYQYDESNRLAKQTVNGIPIEYTYDKYGRLVRKALMGFSGVPAVSELKYFYDLDGTIVAREVNGVRQAYKYDLRGQLLEVVGQERYVYDPAGNILSKTVNGVTTTYRYDKANQLVSSETEGRVTKFAYDAAGRLIREGDKSYTYAWLDKLVSVTEAGKVSANFSYHNNGQIAGVTYADGHRENYLWDGLALIHRDGTELLNEPAITGGNPVLSGDKVLFNDLLGNTLGVKDQSSYQPIKMTAFGESDIVDAFFTGKPLVGELGYAFLFRNYRPEQGKWQTADPLGYPDGWNNFAYVNNLPLCYIDIYGCVSWSTLAQGALGVLGGSIEVVASVALVANPTAPAKLADVSPATVSRVLNNYEHVRPDVRARVIRAARELGGFRDSRNIAVLIASDAAFWSYSGIMLSALLAELRKRGYHEIIVTENSANLLHEHLLDGAISMLLHDGIEQVWDEKQAIPLICINACPRHISGIYSVFSNDRQGVWLALDHLHALGHIRIAYLANEPRRAERNSNSGRRLEAYRQWMAAHGGAPVVVQTLERLDDAIRREKLTAVFSVGEMNGLLTWSHLRNAGWRIPEELSLVCFRNPSIVLEGLPELTSIEQNYSRMASRVVDQLECLIAGKRIADLEISYRFNQGETTAPPMR